jgi:hypothetical protein
MVFCSYKNPATQLEPRVHFSIGAEMKKIAYYFFSAVSLLILIGTAILMIMAN